MRSKLLVVIPSERRSLVLRTRFTDGLTWQWRRPARRILIRPVKGTILAGGSESPIELFTKAPNKRISISNGQSYTAFDGTAGWMGNTGRPPREMSAIESDAAGLDAEFSLALRLKEIFPQLRRGRPETIGGVECETLT